MVLWWYGLRIIDVSNQMLDGTDKGEPPVLVCASGAPGSEEHYQAQGARHTSYAGRAKGHKP